MLADQTLYSAALDASARQCATGERWPKKPLDAGVPAIGGNMILRWSNPITTAQLNVRGYRAPVGPVLHEAPWDQLLVVEARSDDGVGLHLRLEPLDAVVTQAELVLRQLVAGTSYSVRVEGGSPIGVTADADGRAVVSVDIAGPVAVEVQPS